MTTLHQKLSLVDPLLFKKYKKLIEQPNRSYQSKFPSEIYDLLILTAVEFHLFVKYSKIAWGHLDTLGCYMKR